MFIKISVSIWQSAFCADLKLELCQLEIVTYNVAPFGNRTTVSCETYLAMHTDKLIKPGNIKLIKYQVAHHCIKM